MTNTNFKQLTGSRVIVGASIVFNGRTISFFSTHLASSGQPADWRQTQMEELVPWATNNYAAPRVIAADFNMTSGADPMDEIKNGYDDDWANAVSAGTAAGYPGNSVSEGRTYVFRIDMFWRSESSPNMTLAGVKLIDTRDPLTFRPGGGNAYNLSVAVGTADDQGIRPSDHNMLIATYNVAP